MASRKGTSGPSEPEESQKLTPQAAPTRAPRSVKSGSNTALTAAKRGLAALAVITIALAGILIYGVTTDRTGWAPKLALDLEGGTQMVLSPELQEAQDGQEITQEQLDQAVEIIRQRVDGSGVSEAEISTQSGANIVVSMPGVPSAETRDLIQTSAQMAFRPVITTAEGAPTSGAGSSPRTRASGRARCATCTSCPPPARCSPPAPATRRATCGCAWASPTGRWRP